MNATVPKEWPTEWMQALLDIPIREEFEQTDFEAAREILDALHQVGALRVGVLTRDQIAEEIDRASDEDRMNTYHKSQYGYTSAALLAADNILKLIASGVVGKG